MTTITGTISTGKAETQSRMPFFKAWRSHWQEERKLYIAWTKDAALTSTELKLIQYVKNQTSAILSSE